MLSLKCLPMQSLEFKFFIFYSTWYRKDKRLNELLYYKRFRSGLIMSRKTDRGKYLVISFPSASKYAFILLNVLHNHLFVSTYYFWKS
ncbi:hypothetical protein SAMN04488100_12231 [Alkalibacterium putridalgicola]|uniref:Uncharacterized protein n=1 Tax=Alkalibacterium putridalgicola TaxID=426703 RepID=A0A1H7V7J3_9LACT|nr:hypothetical protein SAMN04488100_12231 [Alkalibacterium putridalgicola]